MTTTEGDVSQGFWNTTRIAVLVVVVGFLSNFVARGVVDTPRQTLGLRGRQHVSF